MMREQMDRLSAENLELTSALQSAMEDSAHMSEKLLLSEQAQDTLRVSKLLISYQFLASSYKIGREGDLLIYPVIPKV